jgi:hypothetical protein
MTDSEFFDDLEARVDKAWSDEDTKRLWSLHPYYRMPPPDIREMYSRLQWRRIEIINECRTAMVEAVMKRLDE